jgi:hypothetical protein
MIIRKTTTILSSNELICLLNILSEIYHGIYVHNFENVIGVQRKVVVDWMNKISEKEKEEEIILILDDFELNFLQKSFEEVFRQIEEWEFQTRIGITMQEANMIREKIV